MQGFEQESFRLNPVTIPKARDTKAENNSALEAFSITGGSAIGTVLEPFNVNSLYLSIKVGEGQFHLVALSGAQPDGGSGRHAN